VHVVRLAFDSTFAGDIGRLNWMQFGTATTAPAAGEVWVQQSVLAADGAGADGGEEAEPVFVGPSNPWFQPEGGVLAPAAATLPVVSSFTVIDADSDQPISGMLSLTSGETIDLGKTPSKRINLRANTSPSTVGSIRFAYDGNANYRVESALPYALAADNGGDYYAWTPSLGTHVLSATPYTVSGATGTAGTPLSILFNVVDSGASGGGTVGQQPYNSVFTTVPGTVQAENFDNGDEGVAYHDTDTVNQGGGYRSTGVDIEPTTDSGGGYNVGHLGSGEWLEYTVDVPTGGNYALEARVASGGAGGTFHVDFNGVNKTGSLTLANTGGWQSWQTLTKTVSLGAGRQVMRVAIDSSFDGGDVGNINWIRLAAASATPTPTPLNWPATNQWSQVAPSPIARYEAAGHPLNGLLYTFGGYRDSAYHVTKRVDAYNPATNTWTRKADLPAGLAETHIGVADDGRYIYLAGGFAGDLIATNTPSQTATQTVFRYDPQNNTYAQLPSLPAPRGSGGLAIVGRKMYYISGNNADRVTNVGDVWVFNLDGGTSWMPVASHPNPKDHFSTVVLNGKIYTAGGEHGHDLLNEQQADLHVYDPATNVWTNLASMPVAKSHNESATFVLNGRIVFAGGQVNHFEATNNVVAYDPATNSWSTLAPLPEVRQGATINFVGGKLIITQGAIVTDGPLATTWVYSVP
jgi:N-acetylneuraminic acid mutarotase